MFIFLTDFVVCFQEKLIMASIRKHKGTKTSLTTGKKSKKYRKLSQSLKLKQSLNAQKLLQEPISLEDDPDICDTNSTDELDQGVINEVHEHFTQAQSKELNNIPIPITNVKGLTIWLNCFILFILVFRVSLIEI